MKIIKDERLIIKNLKNIRIVFILQTLGIIGILFSNFIKGGARAVFDSPLFFLLILVSTILSYTSLNISVEYDEIKSPKRDFAIHIIISLIVSIAVAYFSIISGFILIEGIISGIILFICFLISSIYLYKLRNKKLKEFDHED
jgi:uncharacterized membrane protein YfcA